MTRKKHVTVTMAQRYEIMKELESCIEKSEDGDYVLYRDGLSDAKLAAKHDVTPNIVATIRKEVFGKMSRGENVRNLWGTQFKDLQERYQALEQRVSDLEAAATKPSKVKSFSDLKPHMQREN